MGLERERRGEQWPSTLNRCFVQLLLVFMLNQRKIMFCFDYVFFFFPFIGSGDRNPWEQMSENSLAACVQRENVIGHVSNYKKISTLTKSKISYPLRLIISSKKYSHLLF